MLRFPPGLAAIYLFSLVLTAGVVQAQSVEPNRMALRAAADVVEQAESAEAMEADMLRERLRLTPAFSTARGHYELVRSDGGRPVFLHTLGIREARSGLAAFSSVTPTGAGVVVGVWDGGAVRKSHQEITGRAVVMDRYATVQAHATHIAGIIAASGVVPSARGRATGATIRSHDWSRDRSEMLTAASEGLRVSNHAYGQSYGWVYNVRGDGRWAWLGDTAADSTRDHRFGAYDWLASAWDGIAYDAPTYVIVKAAGNDRGEGPEAGAEHWIVDPVLSQWVLSTTTRERDGGAHGYQTVLDAGNGKNIVTVGAVRGEQPGAEVLPISAWGPTADGRIKPDITASGENIYSATSASDASYTTMSGTSMASAAVSGTIAGLLELERQYRPAAPLRSSTYRALLIHTAQEAGTAPGPDYSHGWGVLDPMQAATVFDEGLRGDPTVMLREETLAFGEVLQIPIASAGVPSLRITVAWTDPEGAAVADPAAPASPALVHDLDLWLTDAAGKRYDAWVLDPAQPQLPATRGVNTLDNVEQVFVAAPAAGSYLIHLAFVRRGAAPSGAAANQAVSIVATGLSPNEPALPVELTSFEGVADRSGVSLRWATASETNNAGFAIEQRAAAGTWTEVGFVAGHGTTPQARQYGYAVRDVAAGTYAFRLRQIDFDGAFAYSPEVEVTVSLGDAFTVTPFAPNPFGEQARATLTVARTQHVTATLYDLMGREVAVLADGSVEAGHPFSLEVDGHALAPGVYLLRVSGEAFVHTSRMTRLR